MERIDIDDPEVDRDVSERYTYRGKPYTGEAVEYGPSGQIVTLWTLEDGVEVDIDVGIDPMNAAAAWAQLELLQTRAIKLSQRWDVLDWHLIPLRFAAPDDKFVAFKGR